MKKHLTTILFLFLAIGINARTLQATDSEIVYSNFDDEIIVENNTINMDGKFLANFTVKAKNLNVGKKEVIKQYEVKIFNDKNNLIAEYNIEIAQDLKNKELLVKEGSIKTNRDNVTHNGANFLDYHMVCDDDKGLKECDVPQITKVIKYLISYKYL